MLEHKENFSRKKTKKEKKLSSQTLSVWSVTFLCILNSDISHS
jgi:hypothetical protein